MNENNCAVCGFTFNPAHRRVATLGGESVTYCADNAECGEAAALEWLNRKITPLLPADDQAALERGDNIVVGKEGEFVNLGTLLEAADEAGILASDLIVWANEPINVGLRENAIAPARNDHTEEDVSIEEKFPRTALKVARHLAGERVTTATYAGDERPTPAEREQLYARMRQLRGTLPRNTRSLAASARG